MKFNLENNAGLSIHGYDEGVVTLVIPPDHPQHHLAQGKDSDNPHLAQIHHSMVMTTNELLADWPPAKIEELTLVHLEPVLALKPEILLLGTGKRLVFPSAEIMSHINSLGIGVEVMDTGAACRTFNILSAEDRHVAAALFMI